jgi:formamidopyrimidine-DNA glycosylase
MPELPEVETIKEDLRVLVVGSKVERAEVLDPSLVEQPSMEEFVGRLEGIGIVGTRRRAKHLIVKLKSGDSLVFQLKIGGQLLLVPPVEEPGTALMLAGTGAARGQVRGGLFAACDRFSEGSDQTIAPRSESRLGNR